MKIEKSHIQNVLQLYGIKQDIKGICFLYEEYEEGTPPRAKIIARVEMIDKSHYIVKFVLEEEHPESLIEEQSIFSECIRRNGINTARRFKSDKKYCIPYSVDGLIFAVTVEEYIGEEIKVIDYDNIGEVASLMATMHIISENNTCHISGGTIWNIFDDNSDIMRGYMKFSELIKSKEIDFNLYNTDLYYKIIKLYNERKAKLERLWGKLPRYATQGDYSINNLTHVNGAVGIFDYNISGDEVLVSDMIIEGLFISKEMDLKEGLAEEDREGLFQSFVKIYMQNRKLCQYELRVLNDIYAVVVPFWWTRIIFDKENSLIKLVNDRNIDKVNAFLEKTYNMLSVNYFDKFCWCCTESK